MIFFFSKNISWPVLMNIQMSESMMSFPHNFLHISFTEMTKISYFSYDTRKLTFYPPKINEKWGVFWHILIQGYAFTCICKKNEIFQNFIYNIHDKLWGDDITNSLIWIFIRTGQEMFSEKMWNFKMSQLPYFLSDFHNFSTNL